MISEFQDLSEKISRLAELTHLLRRENAMLRRANARLSQLNSIQADRLDEGQRRVQALLAALPPEQVAALMAANPQTEPAPVVFTAEGAAQ